MAYTEKQQKLLDVLFEEAGGDLNKAKKLAGYSPQSATSTIVAPLREEIAKLTTDYIATHGPKAAVAITGLIDKPTQLGGKEKLAAAKDILDRGGFKPTDKVEVTPKSPLFILPAKESDGETYK